MGIKRKIKTILRKTKSFFSAKYPVYIPVLYGKFLKERVALITGGTSGIGFAIADAFMRNGADVIITGRNKERIDRACTQLAKQNPESHIIGMVMDNGDVAEMSAVFEKIVNSQDRNIDILVNNAGVFNDRNFINVTEQDYDSVLDVDLKGTYFLTKYMSEYMRKHKIKGNILNISSSSALRPASTPYHLAKWGIRGMTLGFAKELSQYDIVVNAIAPGPTATNMLLGSGDKNIVRFESPSGRFATAEEIANLATILVSDLGRMINGDTLYATGGSGNLTLDD